MRRMLCSKHAKGTFFTKGCLNTEISWMLSWTHDDPCIVVPSLVPRILPRIYHIESLATRPQTTYNP